MNKLAGYRTYIVAAFGGLVLVAVNVFGIPVPGLEPSSDWFAQLLGLAGLGTLRAGLTNEAAKARGG
jgi:hypothetical protein